MRTSPSIAPHGPDQDTYLVLDDFGRTGQAWRETNVDAADRETVIRNLLSGECNNPVRIIAFNTAEGWSRDVTVDIADELRLRLVEYGEISDWLSISWRPTGADARIGSNRLRTVGPSAAVAPPLTSQWPSPFSWGQGSQSTGTCACRCLPEEAPRSDKPRNEGISGVLPVPCVDFAASLAARLFQSKSAEQNTFFRLNCSSSGTRVLASSRSLAHSSGSRNPPDAK